MADEKVFLSEAGVLDTYVVLHTAGGEQRALSSRDKVHGRVTEDHRDVGEYKRLLLMNLFGLARQQTGQHQEQR